jgi:hypothetical protein
MPEEKPVLGVLQLMNTPVEIPGSMGHPDSYAAPVRFLQVPGAWTSNVVGAGGEVLASYIDCARQLEAEGVAAIISNCGFTGRFQKDVAAAVSVPVAMSSLLLVPLAARLLPPGAKLGMATYDASVLGEVHYNGAGWSRQDLPVEVVGIEGSEAWHRMADPDTKLTREMVERDVIAALRGLIERHPEIKSLVLECSAFPLAAKAVRRAFGLPVVDFLTMANMAIASVCPREQRVAVAAE